MALLTLSRAARTAGVARTTIYSHIKNGKLSATRGPDGGRYIDSAELVRVYGQPKKPVARTPDATPPRTSKPTTVDVALQQARIEALEAQVRLLRGELERAHTEKARLLDVVDRALLQGPVQEPKGKRRKGKKKGR